jgi:hypothetical protein
VLVLGARSEATLRLLLEQVSTSRPTSVCARRSQARSALVDLLVLVVGARSEATTRTTSSTES